MPVATLRSKPPKRERTALDTKDNLYKADIQAKQADIVVAEVNLGYTRILAPTAGAVGERHVREGQLVSPGQEVIDLVRGDVWIQANYKETQLTNMRQGDAADIRIDTFPGVVLHGKVAEISPASGSQFALLPPDNATGNFTKVVQESGSRSCSTPGHPLQNIATPWFFRDGHGSCFGQERSFGGFAALSTPPTAPGPASPGRHHR